MLLHMNLSSRMFERYHINDYNFTNTNLMDSMYDMYYCASGLAESKNRLS